MFDFLSNIGRALYNFLPQEQPQYGGGLDWGKIGAFGSAGMGTVGLITNALEANRRKKMQDQYFKAASEAADPNQFYRPMSDIEQRMFRNAQAAELQARGVPIDSAYATGSLAEAMARSEGERWLNSAKLAEQAKQNKLAGYAGVANLNPGALTTSDPFAGFAALGQRDALRRASGQLQPQPMQLTADLSRFSSGNAPRFEGMQGLDTGFYNTGETNYEQLPQDDTTLYGRVR